MVKFYRASALTILTAFAFMSWWFGLFNTNSVLYIANQYIPWGIYLGWGFFACMLVLLFDVVTTNCGAIHKMMGQVRAINLFALSLGWAGTVMLSPHRWTIIIPCTILSLGSISIAIIDAVRKNQRVREAQKEKNLGLH